MTVVSIDSQNLLDSQNLYLGLAADTKPTGVPYGTRFYAYDTGAWSILTPAGWVTLGNPGSIGFTARVSASKTRPNDTNAYIAYDAIAESASAGTVWTWQNMARAPGGSGTIVDATLLCSDPALVARLEVDLYTVAPTAINDNAEGTQLVGNNANYVGTITFGAAAKPTTNSTVAKAVPANQIRVPFVCAAASANLFGIVRLLDADTPIASAVYTIVLKVYQD